ncbi:hypothetical protein H9P43_003180 [Blastocladiella emersonii ATCC 22665]|nr:hypothetical protein H9P43_003177 [Blastocladiella emersonii ATCC 22665]KAI9184127.1 hypothetical protein H9P43_003180 [Blastocladiella emersonii ATCC 22665]
MSSQLALAPSTSTSTSSSPNIAVSSVQLSSFRVVVAPTTGTSRNAPENTKHSDNDECVVDSTPTSSVGTLKSQFEQFASPLGSPATRSPCSRSSDKLHLVHHDGVQQRGDGTIKSVAAFGGVATTAELEAALATVHVSALRATFEPAPVAIAVATTAESKSAASVASAFKVIESNDQAAAIQVPASGTVSEVPVSANTTTTIPTEKKRSAAGKVLRWVRRHAGHRGSASPTAANPEVKVEVAAAVVQLPESANNNGPNLAPVSEEFGSDQTLANNSFDESAAPSRWSSFKTRIGSLLDGASSTVKVSSVSSYESKSKSRPIKHGVKVLPSAVSSVAPVVVLRSAAIVS